MISVWLIAALVGGVIILALGIYAGKLLAQVKSQTLRQTQAVSARNERILESINTIALAVSQEQCNESEGAIRLTNLLNALQFSQPRDFEREYPALYELYEKVKDMPTHEARKNYKRNEIMRLDIQRAGFELELAAQIKTEAKQLSGLTLPGA
ncbi:hypothetical protein CBP31_07930 [Oceanisphaera profunda]|uniref:DUF2489 domain-containing protein n=1 Tax=Oceanisphaera profunda TaxID=1416627 RepID=A0A1Y0D5W2_9GAMM|nr:DUF2489 domain-containing protein [Oceanisphaera profunda]ART82556.1 hypothetical protein CBP31_07930 [Oceanisphaera profunda]